jgi:uncharacterized membrane protein SirB2
MTEFYLPLRTVHITCAILTAAIFTIRGLLMLAGSTLHAHAAARWASVAVDTVLFTTALMLTTVIHQYPFTTGWLTAKVSLLAIYIVLGSIALKRGRTPRIRAIAFVAALATIGFLVSVARSHQPLGFLAG